MGQRYKEGLKIRRAVLGDEYVDRSTDSVPDYMEATQKLVTEVCWGGVWGRLGLDRRSRSILNLGMLTALNRPHELRLHVLGALNNGLTKAEIGEILLQSAEYCGIPAALDSFGVARDVFDRIDRQGAAAV